MPDLDLSAFTVDQDTMSAYTRTYDYVNDRTRPEVVQRGGNAARREADQAGSRAASARAARSKAQLAKQAKKVAATQGKAGKPEHLHAEHSPKARKETAPATCKERPRQNKGRGGSRAFVPWCDRRH